MSELFQRILKPAVIFISLGGCSAIPASHPSSMSSQEAFKAGKIRLECGPACAGKYGGERQTLKRLYDTEQWASLADGIINVGFKNDQTYFYLGRAAEGLGYKAAAATYYKLSLISQKCDSLFNVCDGFVFPSDVTARLSKISAPQSPIPFPTPLGEAALSSATQEVSPSIPTRKAEVPAGTSIIQSATELAPQPSKHPNEQTQAGNPTSTHSMYKYVDADGHVTYTNIPTKGAQRVQLTPLTSYRSPNVKMKHFDVNTKNGVSIGMTREQVVASSWGRPEDIHKRYTADGTTEQWEYAGNRYLYFRNGVLEEISK